MLDYIYNSYLNLMGLVYDYYEYKTTAELGWVENYAIEILVIFFLVTIFYLINLFVFNHSGYTRFSGFIIPLTMLLLIASWINLSGELAFLLLMIVVILTRESFSDSSWLPNSVSEFRSKFKRSLTKIESNQKAISNQRLVRALLIIIAAGLILFLGHTYAGL